jgi:hypothetical protein
MLTQKSPLLSGFSAIRLAAKEDPAVMNISIKANKNIIASSPMRCLLIQLEFRPFSLTIPSLLPLVV